MSRLNPLARELAVLALHAAENNIARLIEDCDDIRSKEQLSLGNFIEQRNHVSEILRMDQDALNRERGNWVDEFIASGKLGTF